MGDSSLPGGGGDGTTGTTGTPTASSSELFGGPPDPIDALLRDLSVSASSLPDDTDDEVDQVGRARDTETADADGKEREEREERGTLILDAAADGAGHPADQSHFQSQSQPSSSSGDPNPLGNALPSLTLYLSQPSQPSRALLIDESMPDEFPLRHNRRSHPKYEALYAALESERSSERRLSELDSGGLLSGRSTPKVRNAADSGIGGVVVGGVGGGEAVNTNAASVDAANTDATTIINNASATTAPNIPLCQEIPSPPHPNRRSTGQSQSRRNKPQWTTTPTLAPPCRSPPPPGQAWPKRDALSFTRSLVFYGSGSVTEEHVTACQFIEEARGLRRRYHDGAGTVISEEAGEVLMDPGITLEFEMGESGIAQIYAAGDDADGNGTDRRVDAASASASASAAGASSSSRHSHRESLIQIPTLDDFVTDYSRLIEMTSSGAMRSFSFQRLQMLSSAFKMHVTINGHVENEAQSNLLGTDFYRTMKVDNHIHLAGAPTAKQFVKFVSDKLRNEGDAVVTSDGQTLAEVFEAAGLDADHLTIDAFNVLADHSVYQRFDNFNSKYSPFRMAQMRKIFLKVENHMEGRYFAELTKIVLARLEKSKGHTSAAEMRLSIYGMERGEWLNLARWMLRDWEGGEAWSGGPVLSSHNRWMVQVPRLWRLWSSRGKNGDGTDRTFAQMLENLFAPLFEATLRPEDHPEVAELLTHIVGLDSVDDEGAAEAPCSCTRPTAWKSRTNPAYSWQLYHLWGNLEVLNRLRKARGLNTFSFRPHAGETGDVNHLGAAYMLCQSINHGVNLDRQVSLQYLYYLDQIGLSISPLSNNFLFRKIATSPFPKLFKRGLNVTISTDDPLLFHMSSDALLEEYSVARATFDLSMTDMSELARNSVLQSDFPADFKKKWLGEDYDRGVTHCDDVKTHVPLIRAKYRAEHLALEHMLVTLIAAGKGRSVLQEMMEAFSAAREAHRDILMANFEEGAPSFPEQNQL